MPAGTRGYDDLRRAAVREPLGQGLRPAVASKGDLARMLSALGRERGRGRSLHQFRRLIELDARQRSRLADRSLASSEFAFYDNMTGETQMHFCEKC